MLNKLYGKQTKYFASAAILLTIAGVLLVRTAMARLSANTVDPVATIIDNGRQLVVTGPVTCTGGERTFLRVTVTQRSTGAMAEGNGSFICTGEGQHWEVQAMTEGEPRFQEGPATIVALARSVSNGQTTDAHQWLVNVTLVGQ